MVPGCCLSLTEREEVVLLHAQEIGVREMGRRVGRHQSTISREVRRTPLSTGTPASDNRETKDCGSSRVSVRIETGDCFARPLAARGPHRHDRHVF